MSKYNSYDIYFFMKQQYMLLIEELERQCI